MNFGKTIDEAKGRASGEPTVFRSAVGDLLLYMASIRAEFAEALCVRTVCCDGEP